MLRISKIVALCLMIVLPLGCTTMAPPASKTAYPEMVFEGVPGIWVSANSRRRGGDSQALPSAGSFYYEALGPFPMNLDELPILAIEPDRTGMIRKSDVGRIENQISDEMAKMLREEALLLPPSFEVNGPQSMGPALSSPTLGPSFESLDANDCCGGGLSVPPDPELAVGPNHIIAVVNTAIEVYDKSGNVLLGPATFDSFFSGVANCTNHFDPNVLYDEEYDRFIIGVDADGDNYCVAATTGPDPLNTWNRYSFATNAGGLFFDYPHAGVGLDEIYLGANMFGAGFVEGRLWAMDKVAMYSGAALSVVTRSTGDEGTPQPMNLHGFAQGTWPTSGPHYILTDGPFNGADYGVWSWEDPFGTDVLTNKGSVNLNDFTGETAGYPIDAPQSGSAIKLQANDWRVQDAEFRNGLIWMANTQACNPGAGTVDCVRWASIDPSGTPVVIDAGIYGSDGEYRFFADVAANDCDDLAIGYSKSSPSMFPSVWVTGRESGDDPGTLRAEVEVKAGERDYDSFQSGTSHRWGDYTGMTVDPDGKTFWYLGQYSKDINNFNTTTWATFIGSFTLPNCAPPAPLPGQAHSPLPASDDIDIGVDNPPMAWVAGAYATSHDVYFGTNPAPTGAEFQGNQPDPGFAPGELEYETTYYWQIDEVNDEGTTTGDVWNFTTMSEPVVPLPGQATSPDPVDGEIDVSISSDLNWTAGADTVSHDVYFGTNPDPDTAEFQGNQAETSFSPVSLDYSTTYFWRIDEVNGEGTTDGNVWSFVTGDEPGPATVHIASLAGASSILGKSGWNAKADIGVEDADGAPTAGVLVEGDWSNGTSGSGSCTTDEAGECSVQKSDLSFSVSSVRFTVSNLSGFDVTYDPGANEDGNGGAITVFLFGNNQLPDAVDDNFSTTVDVQVNDNVLGNDDLGDTPTTVTGFDSTSVEGGSVSMAPDGVFTYTPPAGYEGDDSFVYTITDNDGDTDSATVTITVNADSNLLPEAVDDNFTTTVGVQVNGNVLGNDNQGDAPATVTGFDASSVEGGTVNITAGGALTYTPPAAYEGGDSFGYTITDNNGDSDSATVNITIDPDPNLLPEAVDDNFTTTVDVQVNGNVLGNDNQGDAPATVTGFDASSVEGGTVNITAGGALTYTPPAAYEGGDSFGYTITDNNGDSDSATVNITIDSDPNLLPEAVDDNFTTTVDVQVNGNVLGNDNQGDAPATVTGFDASSVEGGTVNITAGGALTYTPPAAYEGGDSFGYTITDNNGDSDSATVNITIDPDPNLLPEAVDDNFTTTVDVQVNGNVLGNDNQGDAPATVTGFDASSVEGGTVNITAGGALTYTPPAAYEGGDSFGYTITDNNGDSDSATVNITINSSAGGLTLTVSPYIIKIYRAVDLEWNRIESAMIEIYRDDILQYTVPNTGSLIQDIIWNHGDSDSYEYKVCEVEPAGACAIAIANF